VKTHKTTVEPGKKAEAPPKIWRSIAVNVLTHSAFERGRYDDLNPMEEEMRRQAVALYQQQAARRSRATHS
jgi:hypothetical protein